MKLIAIYSAKTFKDKQAQATYYFPVAIDCPMTADEMITELTMSYGDHYAGLTLEDLLVGYHYEMINSFCTPPADGPIDVNDIWRQHQADNDDSDTVCTSTSLEALIPFEDNILCGQLLKVNDKDEKAFDDTRIRHKTGSDFIDFIQFEKDEKPELANCIQWLVEGKIELDTGFGNGQPKETQILNIQPALFASGVTLNDIQCIQLLVDSYVNEVHSDNYQRRKSLPFRKDWAQALLTSAERIVHLSI